MATVRNNESKLSARLTSRRAVLTGGAKLAFAAPVVLAALQTSAVAAASPSPDTASPATASPATASPDTASPATASPDTASPATASPATASPATASPAAASPATAGATSASEAVQGEASTKVKLKADLVGAAGKGKARIVIFPDTQTVYFRVHAKGAADGAPVMIVDHSGNVVLTLGLLEGGHTHGPVQGVWDVALTAVSTHPWDYLVKVDAAMIGVLTTS